MVNEHVLIYWSCKKTTSTFLFELHTCITFNVQQRAVMYYPYFKNCRRSLAALAMAETEQHSGKAQLNLSPTVS